MRMVLGLLGAAVWIGASAGSAAAFTASYDQKITQGRNVYQSNVQMKDGFFRMEMTIGGEFSVIIRNADGVYTVMPGQGMAMKTPYLQLGQEPVQGASDYAEYLRQHNAERLGAETIDGRACEIYRFIDPELGGSITAWVWTEKMFPIRFEADAPGGKTLTELSNVELGAAIPEDAFQLPAGIELMDMGAMMGW